MFTVLHLQLLVDLLLMSPFLLVDYLVVLVGWLGSVMVGAVLEQEQDELYPISFSGCLVNVYLVDYAVFLGFVHHLYPGYFFSGHATQAWLGLMTKPCLALLLLAQQLMSSVLIC